MRSLIACVSLLFCCFSSTSRGEALKRIKNIDLAGLRLPGKLCQQWDNSAPPPFQWLDEEHFLIARFGNTCKSEGPVRTITAFAVMDLSGKVQATSWRDGGAYFSVSPQNTIGVLGGGKVEFLTSELEAKGSVACPADQSHCRVIWAPKGFLTSDFALCVEPFPFGQSCDFYKGMPPEKVSSTRLEPSLTGFRDEDPFTHLKQQRPQRLWRVSPTETWGLDRQDVLTRVRANGTSSRVVDGPYAQDFEQPGCQGQMPAAGGHFLVTCRGTHWYTDGELDFIFGYTRLALLDVPSGRIIGRLDERNGTAAVLSPSGHVLAVLGSKRIELYRVD